MSKGKRRAIIKTKVKGPPQIIDADDDSADLVDFSSMREDMKAKRRTFVREYIKDFNATAAVLRMGYNYERKIAQVKGAQFMAHPFTQHYLAEMIEKADEKAIVSKNRVLFGLLRESEYYGRDGGAAQRISALRSLAKIMGLEITKIEGNMTMNGGVMAIPFSSSPEEWEKQCAAAQEQLKKTVRK